MTEENRGKLVSRSVRTKAGDLELIQVTSEQIDGIRKYWPMGLGITRDPPVRLGLVFQTGERELIGAKFQQVDFAPEDARWIQQVNRILVALALPRYLEKQHKGVLVPCAYYKPKSSGKVETGIAYFVGPDAASRPTSGDNVDVRLDDQLGFGATAMVLDMARAVAIASKEHKLPLQTFIGMDRRSFRAIGGLVLHIVVEGPRVFVVKTPLDESEPVWEYMVRAGFSKLSYAPMSLAAEPDASLSNILRA